MEIYDKILNLVAVIIGGAITYFSNVQINKMEFKRNSAINNRDTILVPFCSRIEIAEKALNNFVSTLPDFELDSEMKQIIDECLKYLEAAKRVYLDQESREILSEVEVSIQNYHKRLKEIVSQIKTIIENEGRLLTESFDNIPSVTGSFVEVTDLNEKQIRFAILSKTNHVDIIDWISDACFNQDDGTESRQIVVHISQYIRRQVYPEIEYNLRHIEDYNLNEEQYLEYLFCVHLNNQVNPINQKVIKIIKENDLGNYFKLVQTVVNKLKRQLNKKIDAISKRNE